MNDKYPTLYVRPSCLLTTLHFTDTNDQEVEEIANNIYYIFNVKLWTKIKEVTSNM